MKKIHKLIIYILIFSFCCSYTLTMQEGFILHASANTTTGYYKATSVLNVRSSASSSASLIYTDSTNTVAVQVPIGTHLIVTQISNGYGMTCYHGFDGWVSLSHCEYIRGFVTPGDSTSAVLDISQFQNPANFNWTKIKAAGVTGVIILQHYQAAKAVGMNVGFYFFSYAMTREGAVEEAQYCLDMIKNHHLVAELPIFFDLEDYDGDSSKPHFNGGRELNNMLVNAFCSTIENAGYYAGVYTNLNFITNVVDPAVLNNRAFWYAQYNSSVSYTGRYDLWQYTSTGTVDGYSIAGALDMNYCYRDYPTFIKQYGFNGFEGNNSTGSDGHVHQYSSPVVVQNPTCIADGLQSISCATCNEIIKTEILAQTAHTEKQVFVPNNEVNFTQNDLFTLSTAQYYDLSTDSSTLSAFNAIQSTGGTLLTYCVDCNRIQSVRYFSDIAGCNHSFNMTPAVYKANSTMNIRTGPATSFASITNAAGTTIYVSSGDSYQVYYRLGNWGYAQYNDVYGWISLNYSSLVQKEVYKNTLITVQPTCDTDGMQVASCVNCGANAYKSSVRALGHISGTAEKIAGTCKTNGNYTTHCQVCNVLMRFEIAAFGDHIYERTVHTYPTDYSLGSATYTCTVCDESHYVQLRSLYMYDAVGATGCDSADARMALRCSVGLEDITYRYLHRLDVDYDDALTASDARLLLRISVGLENEYELLFKYFEVK